MKILYAELFNVFFHNPQAVREALNLIDPDTDTGTGPNQIVKRDADAAVQTDILKEITDDHGVLIDGLLAKDAHIQFDSLDGSPDSPPEGEVKLFAKEVDGSPSLVVKTPDGNETVLKETNAGYLEEFTNDQLSDGVLTVNHNIGSAGALDVIVQNGDGKRVMPDDITYSTNNSLELDLESFAPITGVWLVRVMGGAETLENSAPAGAVWSAASITRLPLGGLEDYTPCDIQHNGVYYLATWVKNMTVVGYPSEGIVARSTDGVTWTAQTSPEVFPGAPTWLASSEDGWLLYVNEKLPGISAVGHPSLYSSPDGLTWTALTVPDMASASVSLEEIPRSDRRKLCSGLGVILTFIKGADYLLRSADGGDTWTSHNPVAGTAFLHCVELIGSYFYAQLGTGAAGDTPALCRSSDGETWELVSAHDYNCHDGVYFWMSGTDGYSGGLTTLQKSTDGVSWTSVTLPVQAQGNICRVLAAGGGLILAMVSQKSGVEPPLQYSELVCGDAPFRLLLTTDGGDNWSSIPYSAQADPVAAVYGDSEYVFATMQSGARILKATAAFDACQTYWPSAAVYQRGVVTDGVVQLMPGSVGSAILRSAAGAVWSELRIQDGLNCYGLFHNGSVFTALLGLPFGHEFYESKALTQVSVSHSEDGLEWSEPAAVGWLPLVTASAACECGGNSSLGAFLNLASYDTDGSDVIAHITTSDYSSWAIDIKGASSDWQSNGACFGSGLFVMKRQRGSEFRGIVTSDDGETWTEREELSSGFMCGSGLPCLTFSNGVFMLWLPTIGEQRNSGVWYFSEDAVTWKSSGSMNTDEIKGMYYTGSVFYIFKTTAVYRSGAVLSSGEGSAVFAWSAVGNLPSAVRTGVGAQIVSRSFPADSLTVLTETGPVLSAPVLGYYSKKALPLSSYEAFGQSGETNYGLSKGATGLDVYTGKDGAGLKVSKLVAGAGVSLKRLSGGEIRISVTPNDDEIDEIMALN